MFKEKKMILFDMDGLLINSEKFYWHGWFVAAEQLGITLSNEKFIHENGRSMDQTMKLLLHIYQDEKLVDSLAVLREEYILDQLDQKKILLKPHAYKILKVIQSTDYKIGLATSAKKERALHLLNGLEIFDFFDVKYFREDVEQSKPAPDVYNKILSENHLTAQEVIAIEDSVVGIAAANRAGIPVILVPDIDSIDRLDEKELKGYDVLFRGTTLKEVEIFLRKNNYLKS